VRYLGKRDIWSHDKRALSPIFATVLLATIIIIFGSVAYYYSTNLTTTATNNYVNTLSNSQQAIAERISFENIVYTPSNVTLKVYIINSGIANAVKINSVFLYDASHNIVGVYSVTPSQISVMQTIDGGVAISGNSLNVGKEAYFNVFNVQLAAGPPLTSGSIYSIQLTTQRGSTFDYEFTP